MFIKAQYSKKDTNKYEINQNPKKLQTVIKFIETKTCFLLNIYFKSKTLGGQQTPKLPAWHPFSILPLISLSISVKKECKVLERLTAMRPWSSKNKNISIDFW